MCLPHILQDSDHIAATIPHYSLPLGVHDSQSPPHIIVTDTVIGMNISITRGKNSLVYLHICRKKHVVSTLVCDSEFLCECEHRNMYSRAFRGRNYSDRKKCPKRRNMPRSGIYYYYTGFLYMCQCVDMSLYNDMTVYKSTLYRAGFCPFNSKEIL